MADSPAAPTRPKRIAVVVGIVAALAVASLVVYLEAGYQPTTTSGHPFTGTTATTFTYPCPTSYSTSTGTSTAEAPQAGLDFGHLLGNFSAMTIVLYGYGPTGNSVTTSSFEVLNRSSSAGAARYEVNITTTAIEPNVSVASVHNSTTTVVSSGNHTTRSSFLGYVS